MENASRALMMAAGVLIGILILSLAVYLFANFGAASAEAHKRNAENQISQFNAQFTSYEGRTDITVHDIVSVVNLARNNNESFGLTAQTDDNYYIIVKVGTKTVENYTDDQLETLIDTDLKDMRTYYTLEGGQPYKGLPTYQCNVSINENTQRVNLITFIQNK